MGSIQKKRKKTVSNISAFNLYYSQQELSLHQELRSQSRYYFIFQEELSALIPITTEYELFNLSPMSISTAWRDEGSGIGIDNQRVVALPFFTGNKVLL